MGHIQRTFQDFLGNKRHFVPRSVGNMKNIVKITAEEGQGNLANWPVYITTLGTCVVFLPCTLNFARI